MKLPNSARGFTLIELLVVVVIVALLSAVVYITINPLELSKRGRDVLRMSDLQAVSEAISIALENSSELESILCYNLTPPCIGFSNESSANVRKSDGSGWVRANLSTSNLTFSALPVDPVNNQTYFYTYKSNGVSYELDTVLESELYGVQAEIDGGNDPILYEIGSKLTI